MAKSKFFFFSVHACRSLLLLLFDNFEASGLYARYTAAISIGQLNWQRIKFTPSHRTGMLEVFGCLSGLFFFSSHFLVHRFSPVLIYAEMSGGMWAIERHQLAQFNDIWMAMNTSCVCCLCSVYVLRTLDAENDKIRIIKERNLNMNARGYYIICAPSVELNFHKMLNNHFVAFVFVFNQPLSHCIYGFHWPFDVCPSVQWMIVWLWIWN